MRYGNPCRPIEPMRDGPSGRADGCIVPTRTQRAVLSAVASAIIIVLAIIYSTI